MDFEAEENALLEERSQKRRPLVEAVVKRLKECRAERMRRDYIKAPPWTEEEHAILLPFAEEVKLQRSPKYYSVVLRAMPFLPARTFASIRKKMRAWVATGTWQEIPPRNFSTSSYANGRLIHPPHAPNTQADYKR